MRRFVPLSKVDPVRSEGSESPCAWNGPTLDQLFCEGTFGECSAISKGKRRAGGAMARSSTSQAMEAIDKRARSRDAEIEAKAATRLHSEGRIAQFTAELKALLELEHIDTPQFAAGRDLPGPSRPLN